MATFKQKLVASLSCVLLLAIGLILSVSSLQIQLMRWNQQLPLPEETLRIRFKSSSTQIPQMSSPSPVPVLVWDIVFLSQLDIGSGQDTLMVGMLALS